MLLMYSVQQQQMTFRDLQKLVSQQQKENTRKELFQRLQNKPFWIWNRQQHKLEDIGMDGDCCFNHIIGLPQKDGDDKPLYDYQQQQQDARDVSERYIAKSNPYIVMVSTPNAPNGLFERIEKESEDTCLYKRIFLDYTYGIGKIYTAEEIEKAKQSPSFECEYNLKYLGKIGNVFHTKDIEAAIEKGREYNPDDSNQFYFSSRSMGIDPAYGSSAFGIVVTQWEDNHIQILHAEEYHRPDYNEMLSTVYGLMSKYNVDKVYIDGANPSFIRSLKLQIGEDADYDKVIARYRSEKLGDNWSQDMKIVPVNFNTEQKAMLGHCKMILETDGGSIAINPDRFDKLITALRTAVDNDGTLDKEATSYNDIFDAFRLALKFYHFEERRSE
jgi:Terminase RNaseH-like domain